MQNNDELTKSLVSLIDETINEIDELRKSKFAAAEVSLQGPGDSLNSKAPGSDDVNGSIGKKEDDKDEDDDDKEDKKDDAEKAEVEKAANREADPNPGFPHGKAEKAEDAEKAEVEKAANREADPNPGFPHGKAEKAEKDADEDDKDKDKKDKKDEDKYKKEDMEKQMGSGVTGGAMDQAGAAAGTNMVTKSEEEVESLMKSYVDSQMAPLEDKLKAIHTLVEQIADQPAPSKRFTTQVVPLAKSGEEFESALTKTDLTKQLLELKKSGKEVDDLDFTKMDLGANLVDIAHKYGLK